MVKLRGAIFLGLAILFSVWWWHNQVSEPTRAPVETNAPLLVLHEVTSYHFAQDGVREMILTSPLLTHYDDKRGSDYLKPVVNYVQDAQLWRISGDEGHLDDAKTLLTFKDNVIAQELINHQRLRWLNTTILTYHLPTKIADTNAAVTITTPNSLTHATGATWHVREESFILKENVRSIYEFEKQP